MKNLKFLAIALVWLLASVMIGCKDHEEAMPEPTLSLPVKILSLEAVGADTTMTITSNYGWTATCPETDIWCKLTKNKEDLNIVLEPNLDTLTRTTRITVTVEGGDMKKVDYIDISQKAADRSTITLSAEKLVFDMKGETKSVTVLTNALEYTYAFTGDTLVGWCEVVKDGMTLTLTTVENSEYDDRMAGLIVTAGTGNNLMSASLEISQQGKRPTLYVPDTVWLPYTGEPQQVEIVTNQESWDYSVQSLPLWGNASAEGNMLTIFIEDRYLDFSTTEESGPIFINAPATGPDQIEKKIWVVKMAAPLANLSMDVSNVVFEQIGGKISVEVDASINNWAANVDWEATSWLTAERKDNKLELTATEGTGELRTAQVYLSCGGGNNIAYATLNITQVGLEPFVGLSMNTVELNGAGDVQQVKVTSTSTDWKHTVISGSDWCTVVREENNLKISATACEQGSRTAEVRVGLGETGEDAAVILTVKQSKAYELGEYYMINGEKVGIVFQVWDGGQHGKVVCLQANMDLELLFDSYGDYDPIIADNWDDGRENVKKMKDHTGDAFTTMYPAAAWVDALNDEDGQPGWYLPAINEIRPLYEFYSAGWDGQPDGDNEEAGMAAREAFNKKITDAGGVPFMFMPENPRESVMADLMSSTEEKYQQWPRNWRESSRLRGWRTAQFRAFYLPDGSASIRAFLTF